MGFQYTVYVAGIAGGALTWGWMEKSAVLYGFDFFFFFKVGNQDISWTRERGKGCGKVKKK